ncbi:MAG: HAD family phosphatase [Chitinophagales bacterium]|nr:HAD family phosphatase [Chitinophagales bacterium]
MLEGIHNIIFDLGGVIINLDMERTFTAFRALAEREDVPLYTLAQQHDLFKRFEVGAVSPDEFVTELKALMDKPALDKETIHAAWNAMLMDIPAERLALLKRLKQHYRTYLFSNTNALHFDAFNAYLLQAFNEPNLEPYFHKTYYSHLMGIRKPDAQAFQQILDENGLKAQETLFLDDTAGHLLGAEQVGIRTQLITAEQTIMDIFKHY